MTFLLIMEIMEIMELCSDYGKTCFTDWKRQPANVEKAIDNQEEEESDHDVESMEKEWVHLSNKSSSYSSEHELDDSQIPRYKMNETKISSIPFWVERQKRLDTSNLSYNETDPETLNKKQKMHLILLEITLYQIKIKLMIRCSSKLQVRMNQVEFTSLMLLGSYLRSRAFLSLFFRVVAYNIESVALLSLLKFPLRGKNKSNLKGKPLLNLQLWLKGVKYLIIDEFFVIGQFILGWTDRRCHQVTSRNSLPYCEVSVMLVGDIAQMPPVSDKLLYYPFPSNS